MECIKCGGTGFYEDPVTGLQIACNCKSGAKAESTKKAMEFLAKKRAEEEAKNAGYDRDGFEDKGFTNGQNKSAYVYGAVPEWRKDDMFSSEYLKDKLREQFKIDSKPIMNMSEYLKILSGIYLDIQHGDRLRNSYFISANNGYGKTTFANTCIKELYGQGKKVVPYISLMEIYNLMMAENLLIKLGKTNLADFSDLVGKSDANGKKFNWSIENRLKLIFEDCHIDSFIDRYKNFEFSYHDFLDCDVLFTCLTESNMQQYEMSTLRYILRERSMRGKATIVFGENSLTDYIKDGNSSTIWDDILANSEYDKRSLDKLIKVSCYRAKRKAQ